MFWEAIVIFLSLLAICGCILDCVESKYIYQDTCCCKTCPYRDECLEVCEDE